MRRITDTRKRWLAYGVALAIALVFGNEAANALLNAISMLAPAM